MFVAIATSRQLSRAHAKKAASILPEMIRSAACFLDRLTGLWRYDFGTAFDGLPGDEIVLGTHMYQPVEHLFDVVSCAMRRLTREQLADYLKRLADPDKHDDLIVEFAPILRVDPEVALTYEVVGYGEGESKVDWLISAQNSTPVALEVKNRARDLLEALARIQRGERDPDGTGPAPVHDTSLLFRNLEKKLLPRDPSEVLQGAWITTSIKQEESELRATFARLDHSRVHFAILGDWEEDAYILCDDSAVHETLMGILHIRQSRRFVFNRREATNLQRDTHERG
jgi:hypothetical protein